METVAKTFEHNYEHNRQKFLALQHSIIGKIKSIIGWCLAIIGRYIYQLHIQYVIIVLWHMPVQLS